MSSFFIIFALCGTYEVTQVHETVRGEWVKTTVEAASVSDAAFRTTEYANYKITKVEEINPMPTLPEVKTIIEKAKLLETSLKKYAAKRERAGAMSADKSAKVAAELATDCHHIEVLEAALHAACVDAGVADARDPSEYEERTWWLSAWHEQRWKPASPKKLQAVR
jgi:hypothetical protein